MDNLNEITLSFATLLSPAFIAYVLYGKIKNKDINSSTSLPVIISLVALDFIILGFVNFQLLVFDFLSEIVKDIFSEISNKPVYAIVTAIIILIKKIFFAFILKNPRKNSDKIMFVFLLLSSAYLVLIFKNKEAIKSILTLSNNLVELGYSDKKIAINPIAMIFHSFYGLIILWLVDTRIIPFFRRRIQ